MPANARLVLDALPHGFSQSDETFEAARRLKGAHLSVQGHLDTLHGVRDRKIKAGSGVSRLDHFEVDLLRAAIVFAGSGLDAVLKQLLEDTLLDVVEKSSAALSLLGTFGSELVTSEPAKAKRVLGARDRDAEIKVVYLQHLTRGSLQKTSELIRVRDALGLEKASRLSDARLKSMNEFFNVRNQIVHELDLKKPTGRGDFSRRYRAMKTSRDQANEALQIALVFIEEVDVLL